jgi:hypothetical protein
MTCRGDPIPLRNRRYDTPNAADGQRGDGGPDPGGRPTSGRGIHGILWQGRPGGR